MTRFKYLTKNKGGCQDNKNKNIPELEILKRLYRVISLKEYINICKRVDCKYNCQKDDQLVHFHINPFWIFRLLKVFSPLI